MEKNKTKQRGKMEASSTKIEKGPCKKPGDKNISKEKHSQVAKAHVHTQTHTYMYGHINTHLYT